MKVEVSNERFIQMADCYHRAAPYGVPNYDWMQDQALEVFEDSGMNPCGWMIDLGGGSGRFVGKYLRRFTDSRAMIIDASPAFLKIAERELTGLAGRFQLVQSDIVSDWPLEGIDDISVVFSMSCIHHLNSGEKAALYRRAAEVLSPGGWFMNVDEMIGFDAEAHHRHLLDWWRYGQRAVQSVPPHLLDSYRGFLKHFERWKQRNIDRAHLPKQRGEDLHETVCSQMKMLREAGLQEVDLYFSFRLWHAIAGRKPKG